jgi:hypothetical protein
MPGPEQGIGVRIETDVLIEGYSDRPGKRRLVSGPGENDR